MGAIPSQLNDDLVASVTTMRLTAGEETGLTNPFTGPSSVPHMLPDCGRKAAAG
jgi:hypothetical protein